MAKYIDYISINGVRGDIPVTQAKSGAPTTKTEGKVGQLYMDTTTGDLYKCTAAGATYVWVKIEISSGGDSPIELIENTDKTNKKPLRSLDSGTYILKGYFTAFEGSTASYTFSTGMLVAVVKTTSISYVQIFYPKDNCIQYLYITDTEVTRKDAKLVNMESIANKVTEVNSSSDDSHYPSAKAVYDEIQNAIAGMGCIVTVTRDSAGAISADKTFTEMTAALDTGANIVVVIGGTYATPSLFMPCSKSDSVLVFESISLRNDQTVQFAYLACSSSDNWQTLSSTAESISRMTQTISDSPSAVKYTSEKAVADYVSDSLPTIRIWTSADVEEIT